MARNPTPTFTARNPTPTFSLLLPYTRVLNTLKYLASSSTDVPGPFYYKILTGFGVCLAGLVTYNPNRHAQIIHP